jgi:aminoglycoside phosphotransferase (APT) family kinase protein
MRRVWEKTKTRELPLIESLHARLLATKPEQRHTGLVHADYRLGNMILNPNGSVAAVLDWEVCALGDVLTDLAFVLNNWDEPDDPWPDVWMEIAPTRAGGFPSRDRIVTRYAARTGFAVENIDYYRAFGYWRIAVIAEGMKRRYETGAMASHASDAAALDSRVRARAELADYFLTRAGC